jgi:2-methylcitrate dehydratase PrpD
MQCLLDWIGASLAARAHPLVGIIIGDCMVEPGSGTCTVLGNSIHLPVLYAALVNGAMEHEPDYDDVLLMVGHPTAPIAPAAFANLRTNGGFRARTPHGLCCRFETECRVGIFMGRSHDARGWHGTATYGTFGAMAATAKLLRLDPDQITHAFGMAGTWAAGLKCAFGTMTRRSMRAALAIENAIMLDRRFAI